tara:strand:- start:3276 stop:4268 length:993 start_codon:yes stop_codon:yes gene_type:complete
MSLKLGLIGCSNVAKKNLFSYLSNNNHYELWAIGSRSIDTASEWAAKYGAKKFGTYDHVLDSGIDVVYISLPIGLHKEWSIKAAEKGINIICEKSLTTSYESTKKIIDACSKNNIRIMEAFSFRFHPQHFKFKELALENSNKIFNFYGNYGMPSFPKNDIRWNKDLGGGVLNDVACYPICASRILFESNPLSVFSKMIIDEDSQVDIKVDVMAHFSKGRIAYLSGGFDHYYQSRYHIWTDQMKLELHRAYAVPPTFKTKIVMDIDDELSEILIDEIDQFGLMFDNFYQVINEGDSESFNYEMDIMQQAKFMEAVRISHKEDRVVFLSEIS